MLLLQGKQSLEPFMGSIVIQLNLENLLTNFFEVCGHRACGAVDIDFAARDSLQQIESPKTARTAESVR